MAIHEDHLPTTPSGETGAVSSQRRRARRSTGAPSGLTFRRLNTTAGVHPYDEVEWELRTATISGEGGEKVFEQRDVEIPAFWSQQATKVVVSKYFRGHLD